MPTTAGTLTSLSIPSAGRYVIWAKAFMTVAAGANFNVTCSIVAGTDTDQSQTYVQSGSGWPLEVMVAHEYTAAGTADFQCGTNAAGPVANQIKIVAIKVGSLTAS